MLEFKLVYVRMKYVQKRNYVNTSILVYFIYKER
jgi:hypothetical protein